MNSAILAAIAALVGIAVGRLWDARSESTRWRRDQKTASYQRYAEEFQSIYEVIRALAIADPDTDTFAGMVADARTNGFKAWDSAFIAVWLHGSAPVVSAATALDRRVTELFYEAQHRRFPVEDWEQIRIPARRAFESFIAAVRHELALSPPQIQFFPDTQ
ncbi:hypothetical protein ACFQZZ_01365 [Nocardia sp. GCM10030253]|uniref:hypothetical protein n=1 Tax=Nocardia sp. GCM10030253 TaxID=3273404 RepID=UPI00363E688E